MRMIENEIGEDVDEMGQGLVRTHEWLLDICKRDRERLRPLRTPYSPALRRRADLKLQGLFRALELMIDALEQIGFKPEDKS